MVWNHLVPGRLAGKVALITGGAGNIGEIITRRYLAEGATVIITGRNVQKLADYHQRLIDNEGVPPERVIALRMDGSDMRQVRAGMHELVHGGPSVPAPLGRIDVLVNNAGSAGPRRRLADIPLGEEDLEAPDTESLRQAVGNLLGISWNLTRAVAAHMPPGGSVINVSTIFTRTDYYGRIPYVVPKAALNALGQIMAKELGERGVRVNTIYPGPIESERIRTVFKAMDGLKGLPEGSTAAHFFGTMRLARQTEQGDLAKTFPAPIDVANTAVFLGSDESRAFAGHAFEVTHGMDVPSESRTTFASRPGLRAVDASSRVVLIWAGDQVEDALAYADMLRSCRARVVVAFRDAKALARADQVLQERRNGSLDDIYGRPAKSAPPTLRLLNPLDPTATAATLAGLHEAMGGPHDAIILPARLQPGERRPKIYSSATNGHRGGAATRSEVLSEADDAEVARFLEEEIVGVVAAASQLHRFWQQVPAPADAPPRVLFVSNPDDGRGNGYADVLRAAVEQLIRVWRHEAALDTARASGSSQPAASGAGAAPSPIASIWANQIIRYVNTEANNREFAGAWLVKLIASDRRIDEINLYLPERIVATTGVQSASFGWAESLFGLHLGKVALITGGSAGIGGQIGRLLAMSGARVMLSARGEDQLVQMRDAIARELREAGYPNPESRVQIFGGCDVANPADLERLCRHTLATFGKVDYLINNAGIAGVEEMVVDMPLDGWRHTLEANLISNYRLIRRLAPLMKGNGGGYILNVSSYFGGEKYVAIPYPNRADYAVSKAGQRAMAESFARFLGPQVQVNAIAPGPVEGDRLRGTGERPGLFMRRGRLILENKRLNDIHGALIAAHRASGVPVSDLLPLVMQNGVEALASSHAAPTALRQLAALIWAQGDPDGSARACLMNESIARKLLRRLEIGDYIEPSSVQSFDQVRVPDPFFTQTQIEREGTKVRDGILNMLYLNRMPTEFDVAMATVYYLADRNVTGETFHPSGGLKFDRTVTEGELFGKGSPQRLEKLRDSTVFLIGENLKRHLVALAQTMLDEYAAKQVVMIVETEEGAAAILDRLPEHCASGRLAAIVSHGDVERAIDRGVAEFGMPGSVVSSAFRPLPARKLAATGSDWSEVLTEDEFCDVVEQNITHHFRVAQKVSLIDGAQLVLVTPETTAKSTVEEFALANFIKTALHALTATLGAESERTASHVPVNQVDLTRRARSEEPRSEAEEEEELTRFVQAVLLVAAPLPSPKESRYRARIYRGNAITV